MALSSCSPRSADEIAGTYTSSGEGMRDTLTLASDFTYIQDVVRDGAVEHERYTGTWSYYSDGYVELEGELLDRARITGTSRTELRPFQGIMSLPARRYLRAVRLGSDEGIEYVCAK